MHFDDTMDSRIDITKEIDDIIEVRDRESHPGVDVMYPLTNRFLNFNLIKSSKYQFILPKDMKRKPFNPNPDIVRKLLSVNTGLLMDNLSKFKIVIAGGAIVDAIYGNPYKDLDIFLYDHTAESAVQVIIEIVSMINPIKVLKGTRCITFYNEDDVQFQIILRLYKTKAEVIHGFDLGASEFLFDGLNVWTTALGNFALNYGLNIVDLKARRPSYEKRISKYLIDKNFGIVLVGIEKEKILEAKVVTLGKFVGVTTNYNPEEVNFSFKTRHDDGPFYMPDNKVIKTCNSCLITYDDSENYDGTVSLDLEKIMMNNFRLMNEGKEQLVKLYWFSSEIRVSEIFPSLMRFVTVGYDHIPKYVTDAICTELATKKYQVKYLKTIFTKDQIHRIIDYLMEDNITAVNVEIVERCNELVDHFRMKLEFEDNKSRTSFDTNDRYFMNGDVWYGLEF